MANLKTETLEVMKENGDGAEGWIFHKVKPATLNIDSLPKLDIWSPYRDL